MKSNKNPRIAFFGTPKFASIALETLIQSGVCPNLVVCNPDKPTGRKKIITPPPAKIVAEKYSIPVFQPERLDSSQKELNDDFDFFVVAAYGKIIPKAVLDIPKCGTIGIHPSLLPLYRGATPFQSAILDGATKTGVSIFLVDAEVDHGPVFASMDMPILESDTYTSMEQKLAISGAKLFVDIMSDILNGNLIPKEQNHSEKTLTRKFKTDDGFVSEESLIRAENTGGDDALKIYRMIKALNPEPSVWTTKTTSGQQRRIKLLSALLKDGKLILTEIQEDGKKPQRISK